MYVEAEIPSSGFGSSNSRDSTKRTTDLAVSEVGKDLDLVRDYGWADGVAACVALWTLVWSSRSLEKSGNAPAQKLRSSVSDLAVRGQANRPRMLIALFQQAAR